MFDRCGEPQGPNDWTRRDVFRVGGLGLLGLSLLGPCGAKAAAVPDGDTLHRRIHAEMAKAVVGYTQAVDEVVMALLCGGHVLLTCEPGVAKGLTVCTLSKILGLSFLRIQHTDDLLPEDVTGTPATGKGPLFANLVLADCFDEAPPATQRVLFDAMQERQAKIGGQAVPLERPFLAVVQENPEQRQGKWPIQAQRPRFLFNTRLEFPTEAEDRANFVLWYRTPPQPLAPILDPAAILRLRKLVWRIPVPRPVLDYAIRLTRRTRPCDPATLPFVRQSVAWGSSPSGTMALVRAARAFAVLHGQPCASVEGIRAVAPAVLRHRLELNENARKEGMDSDQVIRGLLAV